MVVIGSEVEDKIGEELIEVPGTTDVMIVVIGTGLVVVEEGGGKTKLTFLAIDRLKGYKSGCLLSAKHVIDVIWSNKLLVLS